jgi:hypothetical protein
MRTSFGLWAAVHARTLMKNGIVQASLSTVRLAITATSSMPLCEISIAGIDNVAVGPPFDFKELLIAPRGRERDVPKCTSAERRVQAIWIADFDRPLMV